MSPQDVIAHFGSVQKVCAATALTHQAVYYWIKVKRVPIAWQYRLEDITKKKLKRKQVSLGQVRSPSRVGVA